MGRSLVGKRVDLKPSAGSYATSGVVRGVLGTGPTAQFEIDAVDASGWRSTLYLARRDFTLRKPS